MKKIFKICICLIVTIFLSFQLCSFLSYKPLETETTHIHKNNQHIFYPVTPTDIGFIFYPGGLVDVEAYGNLMDALSKQGILCILLEMPANLAIFDMQASKGIQEQYPDIQHWYIAGHSLGGVMASQYVSNNAEDFDGLILLASYSTKDLFQTHLKVCSILASNDTVLNRENYEKAKSKYPTTFEEHTIQGGCHAYFGNYGAQKKDGIPTISYEDQLEQTVQIILTFMKE